MFSELETSVLTLLTWIFLVPKINCPVDCVDIVDMGKRCLLKSEYFSYKNFGAIAYVDIVDMDFSVLRPKKWCLLTVLTLLTGQNYVFKTRNICVDIVDIVDMDFSGLRPKISALLTVLTSLTCLKCVFQT